MKQLMLALTAVGLLTAAGAQGAWAAPHFVAPGAGANATVVDATHDGTGKTGHWVLQVANESETEARSITCNQYHATGLMVSETPKLVVFGKPSVAGCQFIGQEVTVTNTGCDYSFVAEGTFDIEAEEEKEGGCAHGEQAIEFETPNCKVEIGSQTELGEVKYHNIVGSGGKKSITVEIPAAMIAFNATGTECPFGTLNNGKIQTNNQIWQGTRPAGTYVDIEWTA